MVNVAAAVIENRKGEILITQRSKDDRLAFKWEFTGGKIEEGETAEECLKREIMEELDLNIEVLDCLGSCVYRYDTGEIRLIAYKARALSKSIRLNVHNDARWINIDDLRYYDLAPADIELLNVIRLR